MVVHTLDPNPGRQRQKDREWEVSLGFLANSRSLYGCIVRPVEKEGGDWGRRAKKVVSHYSVKIPLQG